MNGRVLEDGRADAVAVDMFSGGRVLRLNLSALLGEEELSLCVAVELCSPSETSISLYSVGDSAEPALSKLRSSSSNVDVGRGEVSISVVE